MNKNYLRDNYIMLATDNMMKMVEKDIPVIEKYLVGEKRGFWGSKIYIRVKQIEKVLKVTFYSVRDMRFGNRRPIYELLIEKESDKFFTWDAENRIWKTAMVDKLDRIPYVSWPVSDDHISPEDNQLLGQYLGVNEKGYFGILSYQRKVREEQLKVRHKRETDAWDLELSQIPSLPKDWRHWVDKHGIHQNYIFYDYSSKKNRTGYCTWCEKDVPIRSPKHNQVGQCPHCKHKIQYKAKGRAGKIHTGYETAYLIQKCGNEVVIRQFEVSRSYARGQYMTPEVIIFEERRIIISEDFKATAYYYGNYKNVCFRWIKGEKKYNYYSRYYSRNYTGSVYRRNVPLLKRTQLNRTGLPEMIRGMDELDPEVYLAQFLKRPYLEQLAKAGLTRLALDIVNNRIELEVKSVSGLAKRLGIDRGRMQRLRKNNGGYWYLSWLKYEKEKEKKYSDAILHQLEQWEVMPSDLKFLLGRMSPVRICNYLKKQYEISGREHKQLISTWQDYLHMASRLNMQMKHELIYKPKDLIKQHNEIVEQGNDSSVIKKTIEILKNYPDIDQICQSIKEKYEFGDKKYRIIVPKQTEEIITEGIVLGLCLDRDDIYFDRIQRRESYILFLRKTESPDTPYYTLEVEPDGTVRQKRTLGDNQNADIMEAKNFLRKWQRMIKKRLTEEDISLAETSIALREQEFKKLREGKAKIWHGHLKGQLLVDVLENDLMEAKWCMMGKQEDIEQAA